ncbi:MAG: alpha/beta fold hydrolase [Terracoccus sp.]
MQKSRLVTRPALAVLAAGTGALLGAASATVATGAYIARRVLTPDELMPDDVAITAHDDLTVTLGVTADTVVPGRYGLWLDGGRGHARVGEVIERGPLTVTRALIGLDRGELSVGPARWNQYYYSDRPRVSLDLPDEDVTIISELGPMPAWLVRPADVADPTATGDPVAAREGGGWAVLVHGRGARKEETLRAVPVLRDAGWTSLVVAYRNDRDAPRGPDGRYNLGLSEWRDVEAALRYAVAQGADRVVLFGWSMGGAIVFQLLSRAALADQVVGVVLNSPVVDWGDVLTHHARTHNLPPPLVRLAQLLMASRGSKRLVGVAEPVDVALTNWVARADELRHPLLLIASDGDDFVPIGPAVRLAARRPDLVRFERWQVARHCKEWNIDPERWERVVTEFVADL